MLIVWVSLFFPFVVAGCYVVLFRRAGYSLPWFIFCLTPLHFALGRLLNVLGFETGGWFSAAYSVLGLYQSLLWVLPVLILTVKKWDNAPR
ncbi:MAG: hypothetical protein AAFV31_19180 [Pseudomonadota bacterium]